MSADGVNEIDYFAQFAEAWDSGSLDLARDTVDTFLEGTDEIYFLLRNSGGMHWWAPGKRFAMRYSVRAETWLDYYSPTDARAFIDHINDNILIPTNMKLNDLPTEIGPNAIKIADADALALRAKRVTFSAELRGNVKALGGTVHCEMLDVQR